MFIRCEPHFSVSLIVGYMYFQKLGYIYIYYRLVDKSLTPAKRYVKPLIMAQ